MSPPATLPFVATAEDEVELTVVDLGVARALWEGVPVGRLLARVRLERDERDLVEEVDRAHATASGAELDASWDVLLARLLAAAPPALDRVKRAVARHARAASDEGPLVAGDAAVAALVRVLLAGADADASAAEGAAEAEAQAQAHRALIVDDAVSIACARFDDRLARANGVRPAAFEACLELAKRVSAPAWPLDALVKTARALDPDAAVVASAATFYPWSDDGEIAPADRRAVLLDRAPFERAFQQGERAVARAAATLPGLPLAKIVAENVAPLATHGALLLVATREPRSNRAAPSLPPASWQPMDPDAASNAKALAAALERGAITGPRARTLLLHGGDAALDAIGKEMLDVSSHPFASAVFAEVLAPLARERDVVRLVSYFAIAPDPSAAAHALDLCAARDVVSTVLRTWLETMLPSDGAVAEQGDDPDTSTGARVASCIAALRPYPALYQAVRPLLKRVTEAPPMA
ncbi:MAG: hypothetical protein KIT84_39330 [Labilithrix sp.]|nr:hypothetical protein [Labilithrix sp.]MCW5817115.1 hypothetical protein [Labilithrix sp.]